MKSPTTSLLEFFFIIITLGQCTKLPNDQTQKSSSLLCNKSLFQWGFGGGWEINFFHPLVQMRNKHIILAWPHPLNYLFLNHYHCVPIHLMFSCLAYISICFLSLKGLFSKIYSIYNRQPLLFISTNKLSNLESVTQGTLSINHHADSWVFSLSEEKISVI